LKFKQLKFEQLGLSVNNFWTLLGLSCVLVWVFSDYSARFLTVNKNAKNDRVSFEAVTVPKLKLHQHQKEQILSLYQNYLSEDKTNNAENNQMSLAEQLKQQGLLNSLFVNNNQLILKAILKNDNSGQLKEQVALILVIDNLTKEQRIESFKDNSDVFGYRLSIKKNTEINLTKAHGSDVQNITLTMYKTDLQK